MKLVALVLTLLLCGCVQIYNYGNNNTTTIMMMGTATIPVSALPGLP